MTEPNASDADFGELEALHRAGILTEAEYVDARDKLVGRQQLDPAPNDIGDDVRPGRHAAPEAEPPAEPELPAEPEPAQAAPTAAAPRHTARGRHAKPPRRWPLVVGAVIVLGAAIGVGIALRPAAHHHPPAATRRAIPGPPTGIRSNPIVVASPANTAMAINLDGADAQIAVSQLTAAPAATAGAAKPAAGMVTYTATVRVDGTSGTFALDPTEFTAHSLTGKTYAVATTPLTTLHSTTVAAGQHTSGQIAFTVPSTEHLSVVLFTTHLGEQLGLWSTG